MTPLRPALLATVLALVACANTADSIDDDCSCNVAIDATHQTALACGDSLCISEAGIACVRDGVTQAAPEACGAPGSCGDGACASSENAESCAADCAGMCGDMVCSSSEVPATCAIDCGTACGDSACGPGENAATCSSDCAGRCGDGLCTHSETSTSCGADCAPVCGDSVCSSSEGCTSCEADCGECVPELLDVTIIGAIVAPFDDSRQLWDGIGSVSEEDANSVISAANSAGGPYAAAAAVLGLIGNEVFADVDVHGLAEIAVDGVFVAEVELSLDAASNDTPNAEFAGPPGWLEVPASRSRIRLTLWDEDVAFNDRIGAVELSRSHLEAAYREGRIYPVPVADQGSEVLFVRISVSASAP